MAAKTVKTKPGGGASPWRRSTYRGRRAVAQVDGMGCGVACVAFVAGLKYKEAAARFLGDAAQRETDGRGYIRREVVAALKDANLTYRLHSFGAVAGSKRAQMVPHGAIAFVWNGDVGHYLVRHHDTWMCPLQGFISELGRVPTCYLAPV